MTMYQKRLTYITNTITSILSHLIEQSAEASKQYKLLLIVDKPIIDDHQITQIIKHNLQQAFKTFTHATATSNKAHIPITVLSINDFMQAQFDTYYDLGCFLDPILFKSYNHQSTHTQYTDTFKNINHVDCTKDTATHIATRLRDLFARQSLIFTTSTQVTENKYHSLGYQSLDEDAELSIQCWQFNLFDYKDTPDWLNARFWANPENFDKYRW